MELVIVQIVILVFLLTYLWAEEQAQVTIVYNINVTDYKFSEAVYDAYVREAEHRLIETLEEMDRQDRHSWFTLKLTGA
jgi:hypothetical protein